ncbi:hypothetical protein VSR01_16270 [Actinacidiphila sp. DG2A-62]|uniref:hypothetical protein n=1 Tax=Actinacidiphila sp. DG2A-62 TaxID=3108821 RepID=UPI002DB75765|nr:hypothetical protein [Actinacidiphila sp. DG2A-62]MEC3995001.1 hypothetical protein [Actinacidiphila sp. DG2A-62]
MGCNCGNKNRKMYEVVNAAGKVVYTSASKPSADGVARRYEGGTVREKGAATSTAKTDEPTTTPA